MSDPSPAATLQRRGAVAIITLNRPDALNAVNGALSTAVGTALEDFGHDPELQVAVITGAGRAFCAGADLKALAAGDRIHAEGHEEWGFAGLVKHFVSKPIIAAVNGFALGGGTEIMLACDLAVLSEDAKLGLPEVKRGLAAAAGGLLRLPRQIPLKLALEVALTGAPIGAATAARWGLVNRVVPADEVLATAVGLAEQIATNAPLSVRASKRVIYRAADFGADFSDELWEMNADELRAVFRSADAKEGPQAFAEKRAPRWQGK
ncbi:crotonase/enoyl-CoA hydratase family protein [Nocardia sp. NPDC059246]|uniref:crotonase/enoyl-CoA hydratase family protein n=1 Tax=unclassified Nocardia TaxID=2637762 RepID=UPI0036928719